MSGAPKNRPKKKRPDLRSLRPNPRRQALYVAVTVMAIFGSYLVGDQFTGDEPSPRLAENDPSKPWYRKQPPPPSLVTAADEPLFPDPMEESTDEPARAYEESLPQDVYEPTVVRLPMPPPPDPVAVEKPLEEPAKAIPEPVPELAPEPEEAPQTAAVPVIEPAPEPEPEPPVAPEPPQWRRFAVAAPEAAGKPRIALVIDDMGIDRTRSARIIALKAPLTLSFLTYARNLDAQTKAARAAGHELLLHVTMEPGSKKVDPGPKVLLTEHQPDELLRRLRWGLSRFDSYVGINNHMGSKFTSHTAAMTVVMEELKQRGLLFLDSRTSGGSVGGKLARRLGVPFAERNIFLDNLNDEAAVYTRLTEVEKLAKRNGFAIAIGHPRDATINILPRWIKEIEEMGFVLVPLSSVVNIPDVAG